jgi:L-alanine-DL-glutamate epimerase-like enolase superfamily enzyme
MSMIPVESVTVHAFEFPTDGPDGNEQDGTLTWSSTVIIPVEARAGGQTGIGYTYGDVSAAMLAGTKLAGVVTGADALSPPIAWREMSVQLRNAGQPGVGAMATSAVDIALWDLKARLLGQPLYRVLPAFRDRVLIYGSGGFTNYPLPRLCEQISDWAAQGLTRMKIKTSRHPDQDPARLTAVRKEAGDDVQLFTDANGALTRKSALYWADRFAHDWGVCWFEEPVSSQDPEGLRLLRDRGPAGLDITAGEYGYVLPDFAALLNPGGRGLPAGRRHAVRGDHRPAAGRRPGRGASGGAVRALRADGQLTRLLRRAEGQAPGVLPYPCPHRGRGLRRRAAS